MAYLQMLFSNIKKGQEKNIHTKRNKKQKWKSEKASSS